MPYQATPGSEAENSHLLSVPCSVGQQLGLGSAGPCWSWLGLVLPGAIYGAAIPLAAQVGSDSLKWPHSCAWGLALAIVKVIISSRLTWASSHGKDFPATRERQAECASWLQSANCVKFALVPLAKASHVTEPNITVEGGTTQWGECREMGFTVSHCCKNLLCKLNIYIVSLTEK